MPPFPSPDTVKIRGVTRIPVWFLANFSHITIGLTPSTARSAGGTRQKTRETSMARRQELAQRAGGWPEQVHGVLRETGIRQVSYVPDSGLARVIDLCLADRTMRSVVLTTEEEGVAMMAGAWLGGQRGVLLTQSGGVGNCINMLSVFEECRIPLLMLVSMRGQWGETIPWQVPMGQATAPALDAAGVIVRPVEAPDRVAETVAAAARLAFDAMRTVAVVLSQRISNNGERG
jgi:sulfopyruvate decarboxylase alpha subunit